MSDNPSKFPQVSMSSLQIHEDTLSSFSKTDNPMSKFVFLPNHREKSAANNEEKISEQNLAKGVLATPAYIHLLETA